uniref:Pseudouridine synthase RsuA/RluA-like domain-containing protein n=1 Tax=Alexandrium monilatum TaxID=311494 RepID=A0A6T0XAQ1_9DINO|mmetsp:Transcript_62124/g.192487  ORF Transcript_62124/g.192487 Transcript_62124/m.192487 type:complete len:352 (+) Transcript_62124:152-1207(+)
MGRLEAIFGAAEAVLERASEVLEAQATARAETGAAAPPSAAAAGLVPVGPASRSMAPCLVAEQPEVCLLWKPAGWAVTVGGEDRLATAADALEGEVEEAPRGKGGSSSASQLQDWVAVKLGGPNWPISRDRGFMHGLVHRLDRETSGLLACARSYRGFYRAQLQFVSRRVAKEYVCLCHGHLAAEVGEADGRVGLMLLTAPLRVTLGSAALGRPALISVVDEQAGVRAVTQVLSALRLTSPQGGPLSLVMVRLRTGRLHQIRAHLHHAGHAVVGDVLYGGQAACPPWCPRLFLHAHRLALDVGDGPLEAQVPLPEDLQAVLRSIARMSARLGGQSAEALQQWLTGQEDTQQ